jgi:plasmid stabilization system protein ParE
LRELIWSPSSLEDLDEIVEYYSSQYGLEVSERINSKILNGIKVLENDIVLTRKVSELVDLGINDVHVLTIPPWNVYYRVLPDNQTAYIFYILDARRNLSVLLPELFGV